MSAIEGPDCLDNGLLFVVTQFRIHRQSQYLFGGSLAHGEVASLVSEAVQALLQMQWKWVVDFAANLPFGQVLAQSVAPGSANHILMKDMCRAGINLWQDHAVRYA